MTNQNITTEEAEAVIALWHQQSSIESGPKLADIAEALDIAPEQAQQQLEQVRAQRRRLGWLGQVQTVVNRHPLVRANRRLGGISTAVSFIAMALFGFASFIWTGTSWQEWISFPTSPIEKLGLIISNVGLWALFVKWSRSAYKDVKRKGRRL